MSTLKIVLAGLAVSSSFLVLSVGSLATAAEKGKPRLFKSLYEARGIMNTPRRNPVETDRIPLSVRPMAAAADPAVAGPLGRQLYSVADLDTCRYIPQIDFDNYLNPDTWLRVFEQEIVFSTAFGTRVIEINFNSQADVQGSDQIFLRCEVTDSSGSQPCANTAVYPTMLGSVTGSQQVMARVSYQGFVVLPEPSVYNTYGTATVSIGLATLNAKEAYSCYSTLILRVQ
jgi:hypothetical protein